MSLVLQKKLEELESELDDLFRVPLKYPPFEISFDDISKRFEFLQHLHALELNSQPENADQMLEMGEKINTLKAAFAEWDETRKKIFSNATDGQSICSDCTQTLLYEFQGGNDDDENPRSFERLPSEKFVDCEEKEKYFNAEVETVPKGGIMGKYFGAFCCGVFVGAVFVVELFGLCGGGFGQYDKVFLVPPT